MRSRASSGSSRSPGRPRSSSSPTTRRRPELVAADLLAQAEHGPGGAAVLVTWLEPVADAVDDAIEQAARRRAPPGRDRGDPRLGRPDRARRRRRRRARRRQRHRARAPRAHDRRPRVPSSRWSATRARCSVGPWAPAVVGDYVAGVNHVLPTGANRAVRQRAAGRHVPASTSTSSTLDDAALAAGRAARPRRWRKPRAWPSTPARSRCARDAAVTGTRRTGAARAPRRPRRARRLPLAAARRRRAAQHQREPVPAAARVRRQRGSPRCAPSPAAPLPGPWRPAPARAGSRAHLGQRAERVLLRERVERGAADAAAHLRRAPAGGRSCSSRPTPCTATSPASPAPRS